MVGEAGGFVINPAIYPKGKLEYDEKKDFIPITGLVKINQALLASNDLPVSNVKELIALAKQKPGEITYGTAGIGSAPHMNIALLESMAGVKFQPCIIVARPCAQRCHRRPHQPDVGQRSLALPPYRAGKLKILGIGSEKRLPQVADIPTVGETGLPGYEATTWFGLFAPAGTPSDIVMKLNDEARKLFTDPEFDKKFLIRRCFSRW